MWTKPWRLTEGIVIGCGLVITGLLLQCTMGAIDWKLFAWPVNIFVLALFVIAATMMHLMRKRSYVCQWLSSHDAAISSMGWAALLTIIMGLTRQAAGTATGHEHSLVDLIGINRCLSWWPFVLIYVWLTLSLALTVLRKHVYPAQHPIHGNAHRPADGTAVWNTGQRRHATPQDDDQDRPTRVARSRRPGQHP